MSVQGMDKAMAILRKEAPANELDFKFIMYCLSDYKSPRSKLTQLTKSKALIRIKKGLYVFGLPFVKGNYSMETLANIAYGPSYVSLEWALQRYNFIPEHVAEITSVTTKNSYKFTSPIGRFSYSHIHPKGYSVGITRIENAPYQGALIATKEKSLTDFLIIRRGKVKSIREMDLILFEDMRINEEEFFKLNINAIKQIFSAYPHSAIDYLIKILERGR